MRNEEYEFNTDTIEKDWSASLDTPNQSEQDALELTERLTEILTSHMSGASKDEVHEATTEVIGLIYFMDDNYKLPHARAYQRETAIEY